MILEAHAQGFVGSKRLSTWATVSGMAGLVPFGKVLVGAISKRHIKKIVYKEFGLLRPEQEKKITENSSNEGGKEKKQSSTQKIVSSVSSEVKSEAKSEAKSEMIGEISDNIFFESIYETIHFVAGIGQAISMYKGYTRTRAECRKSIKEAIEKAAQEHNSTIIPEILDRQVPRAKLTKVSY